MESRSFKTLIIGASFYGMALAKSIENSLLLERGYRIGSEFSATLRVNRFSGKVGSDFGRSFLRGMKQRRLIDDDGAIYSVPAAYLLADMTMGVNALFATEILSIEKNGGRYKVAIFNSEGRSIINAERIIDTTAERVKKVKKKLNVILSNPNGLHTEHDPFTNSNIYGFGAGANETMPQTRARLYDYLERDGTLGAVFVADEYDYEMPQIHERADNGFCIIPSLGYQNPISAADAGGGGFTYGL